MADPRRERGAVGEDAAARLLAKAGYELIERNFRTAFGEIDIVARDGDCLVFCEVRARVAPPRSGLASARDSVGPAKRLQIRKMAAEWFRYGRSDGLRTKRTRFDVVAVAMAVTGRVLAIEHLRDAF